MPPCRTCTLPLMYAPSNALPIVHEALFCTVTLSLMIPTNGFRGVLLQLTSARAAEAPPSTAAITNVNTSGKGLIARSPQQIDLADIRYNWRFREQLSRF